MFDFLAWLAGQLRPHYTPPNIGGGHDFTHVERLAAMGPKIKAALKLDFDIEEFLAAVWLHNLDRSRSLRPMIQEKADQWLRDHAEELGTNATLSAGDEEDIRHFAYIQGLKMLAFEFMAKCSFGLEERLRIADAVIQHNKKDDEPGDSQLLTALRIADKLDRFGTLGIMASAAFRGADLLPYDPNHPFGYDSTVEGKLKSVYNDLYRILEWYGMLPSDAARGLVDMPKLRFFIQFLRMLGQEIAEATGKENFVDDDLRKALGRYYHKVLGIESDPDIANPHGHSIYQAQTRQIYPRQDN